MTDPTLEAVIAPLDGAPRFWLPLFIVCLAGTMLWVVAIAYTIRTGIGAWGNNIPVAWAFAIVNFVWWIGIGHAGTFISAFLLLMNQPWRAAVSRMAEAMTLIAVAIAGTYPLLHLGRPWFFYWLLPYPSTMSVWPNFKSPLTWDMAAVASYFLVSFLFFYLGLVPDLATARDRLTGLTRRRVYGVFALGWTGLNTQWRRRRAALMIIAGVVAALVVSVHSIVSLDFSAAQPAGWHSTILPPYFVIGAVYSGLAMVIALVIPVRAVYRFEAIITESHLDRLAQLLLATALMLATCYAIENVTAIYSGDADMAEYFIHWPFGPFGWAYWLMLALNILTPQLFWSRRCRRSPVVLFAAAIAILAGMWLERFVIVVASLARGALPSNWGDYAPTWVDWGIFVGSISLFGVCFLLFLRFVPAAAIDEIRRHHFEKEIEAAS